MARPKTIRVMISSRCSDKTQFHGKSTVLSEIREQLKDELEAEAFLGSQLLEVWINEDAPPEEGSDDAWEACLQQVDQADVVIVLYNGNAGWAASDDRVGICHAEFERAIARAPAKVRLVELQPLTTEASARHQRFQEYVARLSLFRGATASNGEDVIARVKQAVREAVPELVQLGTREAKKGKYHLGEALDWTHLDYNRRKTAIEQTICDSLGAGAADQTVIFRLARQQVLFCVHAIPDTFSTAPAREMVGRPFLKDHELLQASELQQSAVYGPLHLIAVHKTASESQARNFLGHPDVILVSAPFGYYLADRVQHAQALLVTNCRDSTSTRHAMQRCLEWIEQSGEDRSIASRAKRRKKIIELIAKLEEK